MLPGSFVTRPANGTPVPSVRSCSAEVTTSSTRDRDTVRRAGRGSSKLASRWRFDLDVQLTAGQVWAASPVFIETNSRLWPEFRPRRDVP